MLDFGSGDVLLLLSADMRPDKSWLLSGSLEEPVQLGALIATALGFTAPDGLANVAVTVLSLSYDTADGTYAFAGGATWAPQLPGLQLQVDASVAVARQPVAGQPGTFGYSGRIEGDLKSHFGSDSLALSLAYEFQPPATPPASSTVSYVFTLAFNRLTLTGSYSTTANGDAVVTLSLGGVSFGDIVGYLVQLADPSAPSVLSPPWDVLYKINFNDLSLVVNLTQRSLGVKDTVGLDLGLVNVQTIALTYLSKGGSPTVDIAITGSFLGQSFTDDNPLGWDLLNEDPPATPGAGAALLDLKDLGVGQHLVLAPGATTLPDVLAMLHEIIVSTQGQPKPWQILRFDPQSGWLVGANFTVMETVTLGLVFNDPVMYGAQISLAGDKAGPFAGLVFQILYRKVSADVGVYHIALQLPVLMRHLEFGEVSVTLPSVIVDIYTDGGFYLDFGFPYNNDWSVCFGVQVFPFVGAGGFYLGRLTAADAGPSNALVPQISNGTFGPVIEFGVALALGVGKDISEGPLSAGISVTVVGVLTGVVAWYNPANAAAASDKYYRVDGSLAIVGKLYGSVDFKVISISLSLVASVTASVAIEAYAPIYLGISVDVEVEASIKILFIRINFSFSLHLDASFTIGSQQATPWVLGAPQAPSAAPQAPSAAPRSLAAVAPRSLSARSLTATRRIEGANQLAAAALPLATAVAAGLQWVPARVLAAVEVIDVLLLPVCTVAPDPVSGRDVVTITVTPSMQTTPPAASGGPGGPAGPTAPAQVSPQSFDWLVAALLKWGMSTLIGRTTGPVTAVDLLLIYEDLTASDISQRGFDYADLAQFLASNMVFALAAPDTGRDADEELPAAVLPMLPPLTMAPDGQPPVDFSQAPSVGADYQQYVQSLLDQLVVNYDYDRAADPVAGPSAAARTPTMLRDGGEPITEALFADWLLMVARSAVQAAMDELKATSYNGYDPAQSLADLAGALAPPVAYTVRPGDTVAAIAQLFGITGAALTAANGPVITPGQVLTVPAPAAIADYVTVPDDSLTSIAAAWQVAESVIQAANPAGTDYGQPGTPVHIPVPAALFDLAAANLDTPLATGTLPVAGVTYQVRAGDSLSGIAIAIGTDAAAMAAANGGHQGVLLANGTAAVQLARADGTGAQYTIAAGDSIALIAAYVLVRNLGGASQPEAAWYASAIATLNGPADGSLTVPTVQRTSSGLLQQTGTVSYQPTAGDTFALIGGYFTLTQLYPDSLAATIAELLRLNPSLDPANPVPGTVITLPTVWHVIAAGDTLSGLAARFGLQVADLAAQQVNATAAILAPNATLTLPPGLRCPVPADGTLQTLAARLGLTVDALAGRIGAVPGVFQAGVPVTRPNARQADVDALVTALIGSGRTAGLAGLASHFMLHGLRLPVPPDPSASQIQALYLITGQQFPAPASIETSYTIAFTADPAQGWAQPVLIHVTQQGETVTTIASHYPGVTVAAILAINPGIDPDNPPPTVRVPQPSVDVTLDQATLSAESPATTFDPAIIGGPQRDPLFYPAPVTHSVGPQTPWTAPVPPDLGASATGGSPSVWRLPATLLAQLAAGQAGGEYLLGQSPKGAQLANPPGAVPLWSWATVLPVAIRQVATADGGTLPATYLIVGASQADHDVLLALWTSMQADGGQLQLFLAYPGGSGGLVSDALSADDRASRVAVLKANLSTETSSGAQRELAEVIPPYTDAYATLAAPVQFLRLLWEASITASGGFYLNYSTSTGAGLPPAAFGGGTDGQVYLIAIAGDPANPDRTLRRSTTAAVLGYNLDPSKVDVFAYAASGDTTVVPTAPPGNVAFSLSRANPAPGAQPSPQDRTQSLFSLLAFGLAGTGFQLPAVTLPDGPNSDPSSGAGQSWQYRRTVPVAKLVTDPPPDQASGVLPAGAGDPYLGIARQGGAAEGFGGGSVELSFAFRDVFGNEMPATPPIGTVSAPVSYYDTVLGLSGWPGASGHFDITGASGAAVLTVRLDLGLDKYVPSPANPFAAAVRTAAAHQVSYRKAFYQLGQADVACSVDSSLDEPGAGPLISGQAVKRPLQAFATAAYLYLGAAQSVQQVQHQASDGQTLADVAGGYAVTPGELVTANSAADVAALTSAAVTVPHDWAVRSSDTLGGIAAAAGIEATTLLTTNQLVTLNPGCALPTATVTFTTRPANPGAGRVADTFATVAALMNITVAELAVANAGNAGILTPGQVSIGGITLDVSATDSLASLVTAFAGHGVDTTATAIATAYANSGLLATAVPIAIARVPATPGDRTGVRTHLVAQGESLSHVAAAEHGTLSGLALANAQLTGLLRVGAQVEVKGISAAVGSDASLAGLLDALLQASLAAGTETVIGLADIAASIAPDQTILVENAALAVVDYVVQDGDTIASLAQSLTGFSIAQLARLAAPAPKGLYPAGTSLRLGTSSYTVLPGDTFASIAAESGVGTDELAAANAALPLTAGAALAVPGAVTLGPNQNGALYVPMGGPSDGPVPTLAALATASGMTLDALGLANAAMPDLLAPDVLVTYQGNSTTTTAQSTLASVAAAVHASDAGALAADPAVSVLPGLVASGALLAITAPAAAGRSLDSLAGDLSVQPDDLATANSAVTGLVTAGRVLSVNGVQVTVAATDTLASLVRRLQLANPAGQPAIGLADLIAAYGADTGLFAADARLLVPAPQVSLAGGVASPYVASPLTPLTASVTIARDPGLIDPLAAGIATVAADTTPLNPNFGSDGGPELFAQAFETAYADRRLKLATGPQAGNGTKPLWVADFGAAGISAVQLDPDEPRYYALAPMSRQLESGNVLVADYDPASGTLGPASSKAFGSVDVDDWMRTALEAIDLFLRPAVAAPAWALNPAAFTTIVQDKQTIADSLAGRVEQVLSDPVSADALAAAREALRQSMLSSLATAYTTDAVVQFPVRISSPFSPSQTTGPDGATLASLAAGYGLSPAAVATAFADVPYVLFVGATVATSSASHQITGSDTLTSVAAALGLADVTGLPYDQTLFAAGLALDLVPMTRPVAAGDTFATLAAFFGTDPSSVGTAAQDVAGLLTPGITISSGSLSHQVTATDTLGTVATALQTTPAALAARPDLAGDAGLLVAGRPATCFSPLNPVPPRLAGKPVVTTYTVPSAADVDSLLALFEVSLQYLAEAIASTAGIVTAGVLVGGSYRVADGDTLTMIGQGLSPALDVLTLLTGVRDGSVPVTGGTLFRAGAAIPLSKLTRTPAAADSFQSLAAYFDQAPGDVAVANQDLPGTLAAGIGFTHGQHSYTTTGTETIGYTATQLGYASAADFADDPAVVVRTAIFNVSQAVHALQEMPDLALSTLKVPLTDSTQYASFLLSTAADAQHRSLFLDLGLAIDEAEFTIADVPGAPGYQGSDWLSFPLPLQHSSLGGAVQLDAGGIDVPIALRSYPQLPVVLQQQAQPTWGAPDWPVTTIAEGKQWQLEVGVMHQASAQDEMQLEVSFGTPDNPLGPAPADDPQLLQPLAQFTTAWTQMQHDVAALTALGPGGDPRLAAMVGTFASLVGELAAALAPAAGQLAAGAEQTHQFTLDTTLAADGDHLDSLNVTLLAGPGDNVPWPAISVLVDDESVPLTPEGVVGNQSQRYGYPAGIQAFTPITHRFVFPGSAVAAGDPDRTPPQGRDAVQWQHGQALVSVTRNALLVADKVTNPLFVYQTPLIGFVNPAVPLLQTAVPIQVGTGPGIADGVRSAMSQLLGTDSQVSYQVRMLCRYDRQLVAASGPGHPSTIVAPLPVFYVPLAQLRPSDIPVFAENAATAAQAWWQELNIQPGTGDAYVFDISVYSNDGTQMTRPLIEFSQLKVPLS
ncbi:MAG TPA: LysM peptidoglycan-binding domain-containing protein [Trebonia sp.]